MVSQHDIAVNGEIILAVAAAKQLTVCHRDSLALLPPCHG